MRIFVILNLLLLIFCLQNRCIHKNKNYSGQGNISNKFDRINLVYNRGAVIRTDSTKKNISLVFTGHEFADGYPIIKRALDKHRIKASFFFTGDFYRNPEFSGLIKELFKEGHYLGAHSDKHLLYASWENRDSLLVNEDFFVSDLMANYAEMKRFGMDKKEAKYFLPPFEWYNDTISKWCRKLGITIINFTPGTLSNQDWTYPEPGKPYYSSDTIYNSTLNYEMKFGLNGFILLMHIGTDPGRTDKYYYRLDGLLETLERKGYSFVLVNQAIPE